MSSSQATTIEQKPRAVVALFLLPPVFRFHPMPTGPPKSPTINTTITQRPRPRRGKRCLGPHRDAHAAAPRQPAPALRDAVKKNIMLFDSFWLMCLGVHRLIDSAIECCLNVWPPTHYSPPPHTHPVLPSQTQPIPLPSLTHHPHPHTAPSSSPPTPRS